MLEEKEKAESERAEAAGLSALCRSELKGTLQLRDSACVTFV